MAFPPYGRDSRDLLIPALKGFAVFTPLMIAGGMASTTLQFIPSLIISTKQPTNNTSDSSRRPQSKRLESSSGRLTPQPTPQTEAQGFNLAIPGQAPAATPSTSGYKLAAQQFVYMSKTAFMTQVPPELLTIVSSAYLAYHYRGAPAILSHSAYTWQKWAAVAVLMTAIFPLTGGLMVPIDHKLARIAGVEEKIEPYEDMPPDREMERGNTEDFLMRWNKLNAVRAGMTVLAGGIGLWSLLD